MGPALGRETDALAFFAALADAPHRYDFYQTLRRLECLHDDKPRWGSARRPADEPVRLGQEPDLAFAPAPIAAFEAGRGGRPPRLLVRLFGLMGPNGPLPIHLTEYARERLRHFNDPTLSRFLDLVNHRFLALFYRAWAQAQPHVNRDRPEQDRFAVYIGSFVGVSSPALLKRDSVPDLARLFHAGTLLRHARNADGLVAVLRHFFQVPVQIEEFVGRWMALAERERTDLGRDGAVLGGGAVLGQRVWDCQSKFRIHLGPLTLDQYESFLPGSPLLRKLVDWVRTYLCLEMDWDVQLNLRRAEFSQLKLAGQNRLGWTTWLGKQCGDAVASPLRLDAETFVETVRVAQ